ncbi:MAG: small basic protein [Gemmataceae bacterium]|nr:small basic protein [Gemmataceae bacterium]
MSIDKSLRRKNSLERARNVLTRGERILQMQKEDLWLDGRSPYGLPKVKVIKIVVKKAKKKEDKLAEGAEGEAAGATTAAAPAAGAAKGGTPKK